METEKTTPPSAVNGVPNDIRELITKRARQAWLAPLAFWIGINLFSVIPGTEHLPGFIFIFLVLGLLFSLGWGLFRAFKVWPYRKQIPSILPHFYAALVLCGLPLISSAFLFVYLIQLPANTAPFWVRP